MAERSGASMFPREVMKRFSLLPLEEEGRLNDLPLRENLIEHIFHTPKRSEGATTAGQNCLGKTRRPAVWFTSAPHTSWH